MPVEARGQVLWARYSSTTSWCERSSACNEHERERPQEVVINLGLFTDLRRAGATDDIADCVDYQVVADKVRAHAESARRFTVEALAADIARIGLERAWSGASGCAGGKARSDPILPFRRRRDRAGPGPMRAVFTEKNGR